MTNDLTDLALIQQLAFSGRHQECLQSCQKALQANPSDTSTYKYAGKSLLALGQFEKALHCLLKAHQFDGSDPEIVKDIGNIHLSLGNIGTALRCYEQALEINTNYAPAFNNIGKLKRQSGDYQEAIELFKQAIHFDPKLIQAYTGAALSFLELGALDQAALFAAQALDINEHAPGVNEILGIVFQNKNKIDQAIDCYQKELEVNSQANYSLQRLGLLRLHKGQAEGAVELLSKAAAIAPNEECTLLLAQAYQNLEQFDAAIAEYKKLDIDQSSNKMIVFNFGLCFLNAGDNSNAIEKFKIVLQLDELFIPALANLVNAYKGAGRLNEAMHSLQKILDQQPSNPIVHMNLGGIYQDLGLFDQALASTLKSLELNPGNADAYLNLGGIYQDLGQFDQALASTLRSLELNPDNSGAYMNLGVIYQYLGQLDQALASTLRSLELKPDNVDAQINLGVIYQGLGQLDQALAYTLKSLEINPDNSKALMNLGGIYQEFGQLDQALAYTLKSLEINPDNSKALMNLGGIYKNLDNFEEANNAMQRSFDCSIITLSQANQAFDYYDSTNQRPKLKQALQTIDRLFGDDNAVSVLYTARLLYHEKAFESSLAKLAEIDNKRLPSNHSKRKYYLFKGLAEEKVGLYHEAFDHFAIAQKDERYKYITPKVSLERIKSYATLSDRVKPLILQRVHNAKSPVFLLGFPRSGTTLLDTVLRSHPALEVVEEQDQLERAERIAISEFGTQIEDFADLGKAQLDILRQEYWLGLHSHVKGTGKIVIDKLPLNIIKVPLIKILFPNARIILAIRHPCDTVFSCFQQIFAPNSEMANFTSLKGSIDFYDKTMSLWNMCCESFPLDCCVTRYEDLIDDFDRSVCKIINFLGVDWNDAVKGYRITALKRGTINTPSATQVSQPLYKSSIGRWKNYERYYEEHLSILKPWINQWGYG